MINVGDKVIPKYNTRIFEGVVLAMHTDSRGNEMAKVKFFMTGQIVEQWVCNLRLSKLPWYKELYYSFYTR